MVGIETGVRWSDEAAELVRQVAHARAPRAMSPLTPSRGRLGTPMDPHAVHILRGLLRSLTGGASGSV